MKHKTLKVEAAVLKGEYKDSVVEILMDNPLGYATWQDVHIKLNGKDVTHGVRSLRLSIDPHCLATVDINLDLSIIAHTEEEQNAKRR